ncbi:MAG TPA: hypothetical protein VL069_14170 [Opitutus sp.]|nr:hypothetical protein [Opitutus sp.]
MPPKDHQQHAWNTLQHWRHYTKASALYGVAVHAPTLDITSATGFADGRRTMVYPARWVDGQHWIMQTQRMLATREWRLRHVDDDNAPLGRPVHWASPFRWWLGICAMIDHTISGEPVGSAVERAALVANPALLAVLLLGLVPWVAGRFGGIAAAFLALAMVGSPPFLALFAPDNMDHHGLIEACLMVSVVALLVGGCGWTRRGIESADAAHWLPTELQARRAFTISGVAGGFGLWISAAGMIPVLVGIGVGALVNAWLGKNAWEFARFDEQLWRRWGTVGGITAFLCYLLEYFPAHLGWRLEVNHPLYALAWLGGGEVLAQWTSWLSRHRRERAPFSRLRLGAALVAMAAPAGVVAAGGGQVFAVADPFLWSLSNGYTPEFRGLLTALQRTGFSLSTVASCLPLLLVVPGALVMARRDSPQLARILIAIPFAAMALFWLMAFKEVRWWLVGYGFAFVVLVVAVAMITSASLAYARRTLYLLTAAALFVPGLIVGVQTAEEKGSLGADEYFSLAERDLAHALRQRVGDGPLIVLSSPATTSRLIYFGSAQGLGTP